MFDLKLLFYCFFYTNFKAPNDILDDKTKAFIKTYKSNTAVLDTITKKVVEEYCKQDVPEINKLLRNNITPNGKNRTILEKLDYLTSKSIDRNIIVFRKINFDPFQNAKEHIEKGFMSTSIIDGDIKYHTIKEVVEKLKNIKGFNSNIIVFSKEKEMKSSKSGKTYGFQL